MDFFNIGYKEKRGGVLEIFPDWKVEKSKDLMIRGKSFYAVWDEDAGLWSTDEYDVVRLVDRELYAHAEKLQEKGQTVRVMDLKSFSTNQWVSFKRHMLHAGDSYKTLDNIIMFANSNVKKTDYVSRVLPYSLEPGSTDAWDELTSVLYSEEELEKIEWAIGAVVFGDSKKIQKFMVFYGPAGSGKSTILNIIHQMFDGYVAMFEAKALGSSNHTFATEVFRNNPLVAIQHDGDLSKIEDNTRLNSLVAHEDMTMHEKYKPSYTARSNAFLFMGTNQPVKISDAKSGIIRRLIDIHPTGMRIDHDRYHVLMNQIGFELGAIAKKCMDRYLQLGKNYYSNYRPVEMMLQTDVFYNFVEAYYDIFKKQDGVTLKQAFEFYKQFCSETGIDRTLPQYKFREELRNYFEHFEPRTTVDGVQVRSFYSEFKGLAAPNPFKPHENSLDLQRQASIFDKTYYDMPAQYARVSGSPLRVWSKNIDRLGDLDTEQLHWVKVPENHIVIDFDLVDEDGEKDLERNLKEASSWPPTYAELSQSGKGLHLHYIYSGDVHELSNVYDVGIEVKTLLGDSALRRRLSKCNDLDIATISSGLPKKDKSMIDSKSIQTEKGLRALIERNLRKEVHPGTKPSIDFILKILDDAYEQDLKYDVRDLRPSVLAFAAGSTNHSAACIKLVQKMHFFSDDRMPEPKDHDDRPIVFFDVEVYPNLFVVCWKYEGNPNVVKMINPQPSEMESLFHTKLVGFNNRRYDNHILYARFLGYPVEELFKLSQKIIVDGREGALFGEAYNISYTDIYDFSSEKKSLKKFEIELGIHHMELDLPWDEPVPKEKWELVVNYCVNDVVATEKVFEARKQDFVARQILSELSGLSVNSTTQQHTGKIIFGDEKNPQAQFNYSDLGKEFRGYKFDGKESTYRGEVVGEGGYVYGDPGIYENVALLDVASMHPTSIIQLDLFGPYTKNFASLVEARLAIKSKNYKVAKDLLDGKLAKFVGDDKDAAALAYALKIVINIVYGLTSAKFPNLFKDNRNTDNIVAKRGALFMIDLKHAVQAKGFIVAHIKTDSIKIPNATPEIVQFVIDFGKKYGYDFEHEETFQKMCLVNDAVYVAKTFDGKWKAVGAQFQHPYVFKTLFTHEPLTFDDYCETKSVTVGTMYLNFTDISDDPQVKKELIHVGRTGRFIPVKSRGGRLWRIKDDKHYAVVGTKGYLWMEAEIAAQQNDLEIDMDYFEKLRQEAMEAIDFYGDFNRFVGG